MASVFFKVVLVIAIIWVLLTMLVQSKGPAKIFVSGEENLWKALIIYDPDPIYPLDEKVCNAFGEGLSHHAWTAVIATVRAAGEMDIDHNDIDLYVLCANTYNWAPDRVVEKYIREGGWLDGKPVVAITLGSGSTGRSQRMLESMIRDRNANLIDSWSLWLLRPNDENRMEESNVQVAVDMAKAYGEKTGEKMHAYYRVECND